mgnify:FL=1
MANIVIHSSIRSLPSCSLIGAEQVSFLSSLVQMTNVHNLEERQVKELTNTGVSMTSCAVTAGTTFLIG